MDLLLFNFQKRSEYLLVPTIAELRTELLALPVFLADDEVEQQRTAMLLARIMRGMSHDLENGVMIIVRH